MKNKLRFKSIHIIPMLIIIGINSDCFSQQNKYNIGIEGGPSVIDFRNDQRELYSPNVGFSGGIGFQYNFKKTLSIHSGILFERKGARIEFQGTDVNGNNTYKFHINSNFEYLTVPLLARANFGKKNIFFINAGGYSSYLLKQYGVMKFPDEAPFKDTYEEGTNKCNRIDYGIIGGLGMAIPIKQKLIFSIEARSNMGLGDFWNNELRTISGNLLFGIAYKFGERKEKNS